MNRIKNIVIVFDFAYVNGGAANVAINEAVALSEMGYNVSFFSGASPVDKRLINSGVNVVCLEQEELKNQLGKFSTKIRGAIQGFWNVKSEKIFSDFLKKFDPSNTIIHIHGWSLVLSPSILKVTYKQKFKIAFTCHDYEICCPVKTYYNFNQNHICKLNAMSAKCILTNCDKRSYFQKIYRIIRQKVTIRLMEKNNLSLIYLTDLEKNILSKDIKFKCNDYIVRNPVEIQPKININPEQNKRYIYIGRISVEKGVEMFCKAVTQANVEADVIGSGDKLEMLKNKYPNVNFCGWLSPQEMIPYIKKTRCIIVPSCWIETGPLNVPEVQCAYSIPCIIPSLCGIADDIKNFKTGLTYELGNINELIKCINTTKNDNIVKQMSENCKKIDMDHYTVSSHLNNLIDVYNDILL